MVVVSAFVSFGWLYDSSQDRFERAAIRFISNQADELLAKNADEIPKEEIPWQTYSQEALESAIADGKTVFIDFTADWCLICKANESVAINQPEVAQLIRDEEIIALRADKTESAPDVDQLLRQLGNQSASIPFYAVFPKDDPQKPVTLDGIFSSPEPFISALIGNRPMM